MRVLIVEDHRDTVQFLLRLFTNAGYEVRAVETAGEALHLCAEMNVDLLVADIGLPEIDGWELLRRIRRRCALKAIALTGFGMAIDLASSQAAGFDAHLTKPVDVELLLRTVARLLGQDLSAGQIPAPPPDFQTS